MVNPFLSLTNCVGVRDQPAFGWLSMIRLIFLFFLHFFFFHVTVN